jgi:hypothetical protein
LDQAQQLIDLQVDRRLDRPLVARLHAQAEADILRHGHMLEQA